MHSLIIMEMHDRLVFPQWVFWISVGAACGRAQDGATTDQVPVSSRSAMTNTPAFGLGLLWLKKPMQRLRIGIRDYGYYVGEILS